MFKTIRFKRSHARNKVSFDESSKVVLEFFEKFLLGICNSDFVQSNFDTHLKLARRISGIQ